MDFEKWDKIVLVNKERENYIEYLPLKFFSILHISTPDNNYNSGNFLLCYCWNKDDYEDDYEIQPPFDMIWMVLKRDIVKYGSYKHKKLLSREIQILRKYIRGHEFNKPGFVKEMKRLTKQFMEAFK